MISTEKALAIALVSIVVFTFGPKVVELVNSRVSAADHTAEIEGWIRADRSGMRFDEVSVTLENCVLVTRQVDNSICNTSSTGNGIYETFEVVDFSKLKSSDVELRGDEFRWGARRGMVYVEVRDEFVTQVATTRIAYDAFLDGMSQADREAPMSKVSPFFKDQQVARLPQYSISQNCRIGEYLGIEPRRFVIWIAGPDIEAAPKAFAEHIKSCRP